MFVITSMKVIAVNVVVLAGVAQAAVQGDLQNEHGMFDMGGLNVVEMMGAQQQPNIQQIIKKASCALPCLLNSWDELPCSGKSPLKTICSNTNKIKRSVTPCANKCGFSNDAISKSGLRASLCP